MATPAIEQFNTVKSPSGDEIFAPVPSAWVDSLVLAADTPVVYTIPANVTYVQFAPDDPANHFFVRYSDNAAAPAWPSVGSLTGADWWPDPASWALTKANDTPAFDRIHVASPVAMTLFIACYKIRGS